MKKHCNNKTKIILISILTLILTTILSFITFMTLSPKLEINLKSTTISLSEKYIPPTYKAYFLKKNISNLVKIKGTVNTKKIGNYKIIYYIDNFIFPIKKQITIKVIDPIYPEITLKGEEYKTICPNQTYQEEGYQAIDNYDGDLTSKVKVTKKETEIIYKVKDSFGNITTKKRILEFKDQEKPKIILKGNSLINLYQGTNYQEEGYQAIDNCDGDLTSKVTITGNIEIQKIGTYKLQYNVTDNSGNIETVFRTIKIISQEPSNLQTTKGIIYLTFDDGPSSTITGNILDILKDEQVKATFFVINHSDNLNHLIKREHEEGHTVALHSYTHNYQTVYSGISNYFEDLENIKQKVKKITGEESKIIRFPGGSSNTISKRYQLGIMSALTKQVLSQGYHYFDWNVDCNDAGGAKSSNEIYNNVINSLSKNRENVVLMHDFENNYNTLNALKKIIQYGKNNGYIFDRITMTTPMVHHRVSN